MFAQEVSVHEGETFQLVVCYGFDEGVLGLAEERLVHVPYLILEVWQCVDIVDRLVHLFLLFSGVEMLFCYGVGDGCWRGGING